MDDALEAQAGGADRVELNSNLFFGGLTPTIGSVIEAKKRLNIPVMVMIRPRGGGFCYTESEMAVMEQDAVKAVENGADGIVFGILNQDGTVDRARCEKLIKLIPDNVEVVFHRAIDVTPEPGEALQQLIDLGVKRVLTTGQQNYVYEGLPLIKKLVSHAAGRIEILPGSVTPSLINEVVKTTGCNQIHMASFVSRYDNSNSCRPNVYFGSALFPPENSYELTDRSAVHSMRLRADEI